MAATENVIVLLCQLAVVGGKTCYYSYYSYTKQQRELEYVYCPSHSHVYCCLTGCCYYRNHDPYYNPASSLAGIVVGTLVGTAVLVAIIIAVICICRRQQMFAGRAGAVASMLDPGTTLAQPGPMMMYPQSAQHVNPGMSPPPYSAPQQAPAYPATQMMPPTSAQFSQPASQNYQPLTKQDASTYLELVSEVQRFTEPSPEQETPSYLELASETQPKKEATTYLEPTSESRNFTEPPPEQETTSYLEPTSEHVYEDVDHNQYETVGGNPENHTYEKSYQSANQNQAFSL